MNHMMYLALRMRNKMTDFISDERGEVNIIAIVVLIGIAILLALLFKKEISELLTKLFAEITKTATNAVNPSNIP